MDALVVTAVEEVEAEAMEDYSDQEVLIAEAENWEEEDALEGNIEGALQDDDLIEIAEDRKEYDKEVELVSEATIGAANSDAAAALLAAELIDEATFFAVTVVIADVWVEDDVE